MNMIDELISANASGRGNSGPAKNHKTCKMLDIVLQNAFPGWQVCE